MLLCDPFSGLAGNPILPLASLMPALAVPCAELPYRSWSLPTPSVPRAHRLRWESRLLWGKERQF